MSKAYCPFCDSTTSPTQEQRPIRRGRREVVVEHEFMRCDDCAEEFFVPEQMDAVQARADEKIREEDDLLSPGDIRSIRLRWGLTQSALEHLLRLGPKTVVRWEGGTVRQNRSSDTLLRIISEFPEVIRFLAERHEVPVDPWHSTKMSLLGRSRVVYGGDLGQSGAAVVFAGGGVTHPMTIPQVFRSEDPVARAMCRPLKDGRRQYTNLTDVAETADCGV